MLNPASEHVKKFEQFRPDPDVVNVVVA